MGKTRTAAKNKKTAVKKVLKKSPKPRKTGEKKVKNRLLDAIIKGIGEKKGKNVVCVDLRNISNRVCDYFIICEGTSRTQVEALADSVEEEVKKATGEKPYHAEGYENAEWILLDYINIVVHLFQDPIRKFYNLEGLWADAETRRLSLSE